MEIIISRKGFDSVNGGCPSPILPDGTLLSMPIPATKENSYTKYSEVYYNGVSYDDIWRQLFPNGYRRHSYCHLDPDLRSDIHKKTIPNWVPAFGQMSSAASHLRNQNVDIGDVFLFFGWFKQTEYNQNNRLVFKKGSPDLHVMYGYMQIGKIVKGEEILRYSWHPHTTSYHMKSSANTLFLPKDNLIINGKESDKPGYGLFNYDKKYVLTAKGMGRTKWKVPDWFKDVNISYHTKDSFEEGYFQSQSRGQEFVISGNPNNSKWIKYLIDN